jgi:dihydrolipoamide dehydrogenase
MSKKYDVAVLGAGPGGYVAAIRASQLGLKTAIIEKKYWGGVCLNVGCIPSKALLRNAELAHIFQKDARKFGIKVDGTIEFDYAIAHKRSRQVSKRLVKGVRLLMDKNEIDSFDGWATFVDAHNLVIELNEGGSETLAFEHCIIATGATTRLIPGTELSQRVVSYEEQILSSDLPNSIIIAGAGPVGMEFAYVLKNYGVDVTIVEFLDRVLPLEDVEVSDELERAYRKLGVRVLTGTRVGQIEDTGEMVTVTVTDPDGETKVLQADRVLQAIGFKPRVDGFGLEETGVQLNEQGAIAINGAMQTNVPHIYAIGDVTAKMMLAHVAEAMGIVAAEHIAGRGPRELEYIMMPRATYCQPQVASFGYTEQQALDAGFEINVAKFPFQANGKSLGLGESGGFAKLISGKKTDHLLGGHLVGPEVTELLPELTLAVQARLSPHDIAYNVHAHPTLSEVIKEAAHGLDGQMINL